RLPRAVLEIAVREVFFHCGKALKRAALWDPQRHQPRKAFPSLGRVIAEQTGAMDVAAADAAVAESYRDRLY
ncbi:MAG: pyridoxamine 5'-phosphate oxidase family protein, partial [Acetobacteraceae bacterium]